MCLGGGGQRAQAKATARGSSPPLLPAYPQSTGCRHHTRPATPALHQHAACAAPCRLPPHPTHPPRANAPSGAPAMTPTGSATLSTPAAGSSSMMPHVLVFLYLLNTFVCLLCRKGEGGGGEEMKSRIVLDARCSGVRA